MRSPAYPSASLREATEAIRSIYQAHQRRAITDLEVVKAMSYKGLSGPSRSKMSALKKFGLLERQANGWRLSDRAMQIILKPPGSPERETAMVDAANDIDLFQRLMESHQDASEGTITSHLEADLAFTREGAKAAAQSFRETMDLISTISPDTMSADSRDKVDGSRGVSHSHDSSVVTHFPIQANAANLLPLPLMRDDGGFEMVHIPRNLSESEYKFLAQLLVTYKPAILARQQTDKTPECDSTDDAQP